MDDTPADTLEVEDTLPAVAPDRDGEADDEEFDDLPDEPELSDAELVAKLQRSMADYEAGRFRPAKDVMREIAAENGFPFAE